MADRIKSVYLDATIPSHYFDNRDEIHAFVLITKKWWDTQRQYFNLYSSIFTLTELQQGDYPNKDGIISLLNGISQLEHFDEIDQIASVYIKEYVMPEGSFGDAFHLACASYHKIDYLLTWNCNHLANANKDQHIRITNAKLGLSTPRIITPLELFYETE
jgi:hypothetical protein